MQQLWRLAFLWWQRQFGRLGRFIGQRPLVCFISSVLLVCVCCVGFLKASFVNQIDELWVPSNSQTVVNQKGFDAVFTTDPYSRVERVIIVPKNSSTDMLTPQILTQVFAVKDGIFNLSVKPAQGDDTNSQGRTTLAEMCAEMKAGSGCVYFDPLGYWDNNETKMLSRSLDELHYDANQLLLSGNVPVQQRMVLGCLVKVPSGLFDGDTKVVSVGALLFTFFMDKSRANATTIEAWESALLDYLDSAAFPDITAYAQTGVSIAKEISSQSGGDVILLALVFGLMSVYVVFAMFTWSPLRTRIILGVMAVVCVLAGVLASLGFTALFWQFNPLTIQVLPFLMLSIGMDSLFILFTHYQVSLHSLPFGKPTCREDYTVAMEDALYRQGASVALTALTKAVAFLGPVIVLRIPALMQFCIVVSISICFEVWLALFAFCPLLFFDALRENSRRADVLPCIKLPAVSESDLAADPADKAGTEQGGADACDGADGVDAKKRHSEELTGNGETGAEELQVLQEGSWRRPQEETEGRASPALPPNAHASVDSLIGASAGYTTKDYTSSSSSSSTSGEDALALGLPDGDVVPSPGKGKKKQGGKGLLDLTKESERQRNTPLGKFIFGFYVPKILCSVWGQVVVYCVFLGLLAAGIYGCATVNESLDVQSLITEGTQLYNYLGYETKCDTHIGPPMYLVTGAADYTQPSTAAAVRRLVAAVENSSYIEKPIYSWYSDFTDKFLTFSNWSSLLDENGWPVSPTIFYWALDDFLTGFSGAAYKDNLVVERSPNGQIIGITNTRMQGFYNPLNTTKDYVHAMLQSREAVKTEPQLSAYTESYYYVFYEQFLSIVQQYVLMLALTVAAIFVVTLAFMGLKTGLVVSFMVLMIHVDMLGLTSFMGVMMNAVSAVNAVAIMGLADEYVNYVMRAFELEEGTPEDRIKSALLQYLHPISNAAICTVIGILPLAFAKSALYKVYYFRMFFIATILSWMTGVIFLPVVLLSTHGVGLGACVKNMFKRKPKPALVEVPESEPPTVENDVAL